MINSSFRFSVSAIEHPLLKVTPATDSWISPYTFIVHPEKLWLTTYWVSHRPILLRPVRCHSRIFLPGAFRFHERYFYLVGSARFVGQLRFQQISSFGFRFVEKPRGIAISIAFRVTPSVTTRRKRASPFLVMVPDQLTIYLGYEMM
ncbi:hypothetical protein EVAR_47861_1 [Eumeta japonica]|uniref:Uncharacterized protein n=1 Tax=Eumeta variegata TaxID=151549 RepID=A0A4C1ZYM7_EUMVA|nr:hypothetical protein EVAR_47861_1 [Eumeta japonica]